MKKVSKAVSTKSVKTNPKSLTVKKSELDLSLGLFMGVIAIGLSMLSLVKLNSMISLSALVFGALAVWLSVRKKHYHVIFSGMAAMLVALAGLSQYLNLVSGN